MEQKANWYDEVYKTKTEYFKEPEESIYINVWQKAISLINYERILDFGCGPGQFAKLALKLKKRYILGMDFSKEAISIAKKLNNENQGKFAVSDLLKRNKFPAHDLIVCFEVLEHITNDFDIIKKIEKGKRFIFSVPNYDSASHVRKFNSEAEVFSRYSELLEIRYIYPIEMKGTAIIYLVDSVKI